MVSLIYLYLLWFISTDTSFDLYISSLLAQQIRLLDCLCIYCLPYKFAFLTVYVFIACPTNSLSWLFVYLLLAQQMHLLDCLCIYCLPNKFVFLTVCVFIVCPTNLLSWLFVYLLLAQQMHLLFFLLLRNMIFWLDIIYVYYSWWLNFWKLAIKDHSSQVWF